MTIPFGKPSGMQAIDILNWEKDYPYRPEVGFEIWHDGQWLHLKYTVNEETTKAEQTILGGEVFRDSCVEFFIQPDPENDPHYYNFEFNAAGVMYLACRTGRMDPEYAPREILESVKTESTVGPAPFGETALGKPWTLKVDIPITAFFKHSFKSWSGLKAKMNLYKCGEGLKTMAFVTWAPIDTPKPDYHRPEFFREAEFE